MSVFCGNIKAFTELNWSYYWKDDNLHSPNDFYVVKHCATLVCASESIYLQFKFSDKIEHQLFNLDFDQPKTQGNDVKFIIDLYHNYKGELPTLLIEKASKSKAMFYFETSEWQCKHCTILRQLFFHNWKITFE